MNIFLAAESFVKFSAFLGLLVTTALLVSLGNKSLNRIITTKNATYYMLLLSFSIIPLMLLLFVFSLVFGSIF